MLGEWASVDRNGAWRVGTDMLLSLLSLSRPRGLRRFALVAVLLSAACSRPAPPGAEGASRPVAPAAALDRAAVRAQLAEHRTRELAHLHEYGVAGQFPHNTTTAPSLHMFRDPEGRLCAVADLIQTDGRGDLVEATVLAQNDVAIADVHGGAMMDWIVRSGLTQEELVRIQAPAPFLARRPPPLPRPAADPLNVATAPSPEEQMNAAIASHVTQVEAELRASTERSLDVRGRAVRRGGRSEAAGRELKLPSNRAVSSGESRRSRASPRP